MFCLRQVVEYCHDSQVAQSVFGVFRFCGIAECSKGRAGASAGAGSNSAAEPSKPAAFAGAKSRAKSDEPAYPKHNDSGKDYHGWV
jgi:hypothetical protein